MTRLILQSIATDQGEAMFELYTENASGGQIVRHDDSEVPYVICYRKKDGDLEMLGEVLFGAMALLQDRGVKVSEVLIRLDPIARAI